MSFATWLQGPAAPAASGAAALPPFEPAAAPASEEPAPVAEPAPAPAPAPAPTPAAAGPNYGARYLVAGDGRSSEPPPRNPYLVGGGADIPATPRPTAWSDIPPKKRKVVFALMPTTTFGLSPIPSASVTFFVGGRFKRSENWSVGYMPAVSIGLAERYVVGVLTHRHYVGAINHFKKRGFASMGLGLGFLLWHPALLEAEGRLGARLGKWKRFIIGGQVRLGWNFYFHEKAPLPQFGGFFGWSFL